MKVGDRVKLKYTRDVEPGTISHIFPDGAFQITYDSVVVEGRRVPGGKFVYKPRQIDGFTSA